MLFVYVTFPDKDSACAASESVVEMRLAACANIMAPHTAIYRWEGKTERAGEVAVIFKTRSALFESLKDKIVELHPYECPCVVALPIEKGHGPYLAWVEEETG